MVLDTSALLALLLDEPEAEEFRAAVEEDTTRLVSAATLLEDGPGHRGPEGRAWRARTRCADPQGRDRGGPR